MVKILFKFLFKHFYNIYFTIFIFSSSAFYKKIKFSKFCDKDLGNL